MITHAKLMTHEYYHYRNLPIFPSSKWYRIGLYDVDQTSGFVL